MRGLATQVGGQLKPGVLTTVGNTWKGSAATAHGKIIQPQGAAADKVGAISDKISTALQLSAAAGLVFYLAIGAILVKFIAAMVTVIAAFGTAVLSWAGAALVIEEAGVNSALIWTAIGALSAALATQAQQLIVVHGELSDQSAFPSGHWPDPTTGSYNDGSVKDGDADWSLTRTAVISAIDGSAGVGKTALAIHFGQRVAGRFPDGQLFVDLRGYAPGGPMSTTEALGQLLRGLGVPPDRVPADVQEQSATYRSVLAGKRILVILDNARGAGQVVPLLPGDPGCFVVITSRTTLATVAGATHLNLDLLPRDEAVTLLARFAGRTGSRPNPMPPTPW